MLKPEIFGSQTYLSDIYRNGFLCYRVNEVNMFFLGKPIKIYFYKLNSALCFFDNQSTSLFSW